MNRLLLATAIVCATAVGYVGRVDTIGGTTYDWQMGGPQWRMLVCAQAHGVHATWLSSADGSPWADRGYRYNFYDFPTRRWGWLDSNCLYSGTSMFAERNGLGSLDRDPVSGVAVMSTHVGNIYPVVARDVAPGAGMFEYCSGQPQLDYYQWPALAMSGRRNLHLHLIDNSSQDMVWYSRGSPWCDWSQPVRVAPPELDPEYPSHNIAADKVGARVCLTWVCSDVSSLAHPGFYRLSPDDGLTWEAPAELPVPPAFGPDTVTAFTLWGLFPWFDDSSRLHIMANVMPIVRDTGYVSPAAVWHWCEANTPRWSLVRRTPDIEPRSTCGYGAVMANRPSIGQDSRGNLYVAWEEFYPYNVEPVTNCLRAGVWLAASIDGGNTWLPGQCITDSNTVSHRFPCVSDVQVPGEPRDTVIVSYMMDLQAGFDIQGQGHATENPVVCQFVPIDLLGVKADETVRASGAALGATILRGVLYLPPSPNPLPGGEGQRVRGQNLLVDALGRKVLDLKAGDNDVSRLAPGVYFVRGWGRGARDEGASVKVVIAR